MFSICNSTYMYLMSVMAVLVMFDFKCKHPRLKRWPPIWCSFSTPGGSYSQMKIRIVHSKEDGTTMYVHSLSKHQGLSEPLRRTVAVIWLWNSLMTLMDNQALRVRTFHEDMQLTESKALDRSMGATSCCSLHFSWICPAANINKICLVMIWSQTGIPERHPQHVGKDDLKGCE